MDASKTVCTGVATSLLKKVTGMSTLGLAAEIYFRALVWCNMAPLNVLGISTEAYRRAKNIDLDNGGDTWKRKVVYAAAWAGTFAVSPF